MRVARSILSRVRPPACGIRMVAGWVSSASRRRRLLGIDIGGEAGELAAFETGEDGRRVDQVGARGVDQDRPLAQPAMAAASTSGRPAGGQCRVTTSARENRSSRATSGTSASGHDACSTNGSWTSGHMPRPSASRATMRPMLPPPTMPSVRPSDFVAGVPLEAAGADPAVGSGDHAAMPPASSRSPVRQHRAHWPRRPCG